MFYSLCIYLNLFSHKRITSTLMKIIIIFHKREACVIYNNDYYIIKIANEKI